MQRRAGRSSTATPAPVASSAPMTRHGSHGEKVAEEKIDGGVGEVARVCVREWMPPTPQFIRQKQPRIWWRALRRAPIARCGESACVAINSLSRMRKRLRPPVLLCRREDESDVLAVRWARGRGERSCSASAPTYFDPKFSPCLCPRGKTEQLASGR
jgi:hypothetical protein